MKSKILIITLLIIYHAGFVKSQGVRLFTSADGLPGSQFTHMTQDQDGYIWMCNYGGLAKFNGLGLSGFYESDRTGKLRSNRIFRFFTDQRGQCWIGTSRGLQVFHPKTESFEHIILDKNEDTLSSQNGKAISVSDIVSLPDGKNVLVNGGVDGYFVVDIVSHKINEQETKKINLFLKGIISRRIFIDSKSRLWIVSKTLHVFDTKTNKFIPISYSTQNRLDPEKMEITDFLEDKASNTLLISDKWNGVLFYDEEKHQISSINSSIPNYQSAQCLLKRKDGTLLVGCENNGIGRINLNKKEITEYKIKESPLNIKECKIHSMVEDRWGNLFIGIHQKGLLVVPAATGKFSYKGITDSPVIQNRAAVTSFTQNENGTVYIGTDGYGVLYGKDIENLKQLQLPLACNGAVQQLVSIKNNMWIATYGSGLYLYNGLGSKAINDTEDIISKNASSLQFDALHQKLYIGTIGSGLNQLDLTSGKMTTIALPANQWVSALKLDSKGKLWIGNSGCMLYDPDQKKLCTIRLNTGNTTILTFFEQNGLMYIGTNNGLFAYNLKSNVCRHFPLNTENKAISVLAIAGSNDHSLWLSTNVGIVRFEPLNQNLRIFSSFDIKRVGDFHSNAVFCRKDGTIIFGGDNGIVSFNPDSIINNKTKWNPIRFCGLNVNGKSVSFDSNSTHNLLDASISYASQITLPYNQNSLSVSFSALDYSATSQLHYKYQLSGFEKEWHYTTADNPQAVYNQLPSGSYMLTVKSINEGNETTVSQAQIKIIVKNPWYWSWWSKLMYAFILILIVFNQYRVYQIKQRSKKRLRTVMSEFLQLKENYRTFIQTQNTEKTAEVETLDEKLKRKIKEVITNHISDSGFGVEEMSREIAVSRVHLYRRTKEIFGCSPNDLIKSIRMKRAGILLIREKLPVAEVAHRVGFSEPSYFSKSFKAYYNMSPKEFVARYRDNADEKVFMQLFEL